MNKILVTFAAVLAIASFLVQATTAPETLNSEAVQLMGSGASESELRQVVELTGRALDADNEYLPARTTRINALLQLGEMDRVADEAEALAQLDSSAENQLYACMAREAAHSGYPKQQACYAGVIEAFKKGERSPEGDPNYLMALKLANHPEFENFVWRYIENQESAPAREVAEYMFIESSRDDVLRNYFSW